jgi:ankyrin repeat protein
LKEEEMAERIGPYGSNPYGSVPHLWSAPLVQTEAEKALKMVDPLGWHFPSAEDKARFCAFFDISGVDVGNEFQVHQFCSMYRNYLFPKPEGISYVQREVLNARGRDDQTLLARAIQLNPSLIPDLVACGADVNRPCTGLNFAGGRMTPLFLAAQSGHTESIPALVRAGANIDEVRPDTLETPLIRAASQEHTCIAALTLIDNGANVDCQDRYGRTALQYAIRWNDRDLVSLLIEKRAPFDSACYNQLLKAPDLLQYVKQQHPNLIALIVNGGDPALIPALVNQGFDIEARGPGGYTALHVAVGNGNQAIVLQLLSLGADINAVRQPQSMTPLSFAIFGKNLSMINLLKENGANLGLLTKVDREAYVEFFSGGKNY